MVRLEDGENGAAVDVVALSDKDTSLSYPSSSTEGRRLAEGGGVLVLRAGEDVDVVRGASRLGDLMLPADPSGGGRCELLSILGRGMNN